MTTGLLLLMFTALLVAPVSVLLGAAAGALFTYRVLKGMSPVPSLRPRPKPEDEKDEQPQQHRPRLRLGT